MNTEEQSIATVDDRDYGEAMTEEDIYRWLADRGLTPAQVAEGVRQAKQRKLVPEDIMPMIDGRSFRCDCGANVFRHPEGEPLVFVCNSCQTRFRGEL